MSRTATFSLVCLLCACAAFAQPSRTTPAACEALRQLQVSGVALTVTRTEWFAAGAPLPGGRGGGPPVASALPAYCRIDGVIDRRTGTGGTTYGIGFALALPEDWSGRFLMQGGGGLNGSVQAPVGKRARLRAGFAASTLAGRGRHTTDGRR